MRTGKAVRAYCGSSYCGGTHTQTFIVTPDARPLRVVTISRPTPTLCLLNGWAPPEGVGVVGPPGGGPVGVGPGVLVGPVGVGAPEVTGGRGSAAVVVTDDVEPGPGPAHAQSQSAPARTPEK